MAIAYCLGDQAKPGAARSLYVKKNNNNKELKIMTQATRLWHLSDEIQQLENAICLQQALRDRVNSRR